MSQRNPLNERYKTELKGQTRKSAASMKPKSKAAASVYVKPQVKTRKQKKEEAKAEQMKRGELNRMYYSPPTPEYKKFRRVWWVILIAAILMTTASMVMTFTVAQDDPGKVMPILVPAYALIIAALVLDFTKGRKMRLAYQQEMQRKQHKTERRAIEAAAMQEVKNVGKSEEMAKEEGPISRLAIRIGRFLTFKKHADPDQSDKKEEK